MNNISVIIPTYNEGHNMDELLQSVLWADEIIVVDSFSTDNTIEIAKKYNCRILQREFDYPASQKNWAIPQAKHEWILLFDADERPTPELIDEIQELLKNEDSSPVAYWIHRNNQFMGRPVRFSGWQNDSVIRLFRRDLCRYEDKMVHEEILADGTVGRLKNSMDHNTFRSLEQYRSKLQRYAEWSAKDHLDKTPNINFYHLWIKPAIRFLKHYLFQLGFLDGKVGYQISKLMAWSVRLRYQKMKLLRSG